MAKNKTKKRPRYQRKPQASKKKQSYVFWIVIVVTVVGVLALIWWGGKPHNVGKAVSPAGMSMGNAKAPVKIDVYTDFQCPYCGRFERDTLPKIIENYVKPGKARLTVHVFAFLGQESAWAAEAAYCANDQGKFWPYHDKLFNSQAGENQGAFNIEHLKAFAKALGLNTKQFDACLDSQKYQAAIQQAQDAAKQRGVHSTPTIFIDQKLILGAQPYKTFADAIDAALQKGK